MSIPVGSPPVQRAIARILVPRDRGLGSFHWPPGRTRSGGRRQVRPHEAGPAPSRRAPHNEALQAELVTGSSVGDVRRAAPIRPGLAD